jgi:hypothetical protein
MLGLNSFHKLFIALAIVMTAGSGTWSLLHQYDWTGAILLGSSVLLVGYGAYFSGMVERAHLKE